MAHSYHKFDLQSQLLFCNAVEEALKCGFATETALETYHSTLIGQLTRLTELVSQCLATHNRFALEALLTISVHSRDILRELIDSGICSTDEFGWTR